jgi:hypothetical protein
MREHKAGLSQRDPQTGSSSLVEHPRLLDDLETTRLRMRRVLLWQTLVWIGMTLLGLVTLLALADWMWVVPRWARASALVGSCATVLAGLARLWPRTDRNQVAVSVERQFPELGQRVQTVLEYARPGPQTAPASPGLVRSLVDETDNRTSGLDFKRVIPWSALRKSLAVLVLALAPMILGLFFGSSGISGERRPDF